MRFAPNYSGSGSLSGASEWTRIAENKEPKAMALETRLAAVAEFKGDIGSNWIVRSEDETINGKNVLDCTVKAGWIFTVSADLSETLQLNSAGDALGTLNLSYGDMIILLDSRCDYVNAWRLLYDGSMKSRITENDKKLLEIERKLELHISDWVSVQSIVREGRAPEVFAIGDQLICNHKTYGELVWDIIGFDHDVPVDSTKTHSMTVQLHSIPDSLQFDASEALYYAETELPAGTYNFTLLAGYDVTYGGGKTYYFTIAKPVPAGGQIVFNWGYNKQAADCKIATYGSQTSTTVIETVAVTEGNEGTALSNTNHSHRIRYGSNRWTQSAIRQWLNSDEASGAWWKPSNIYDRPVNYTSSKSGFLNGIDADFISVIGEVTKRNALNTVSDGGGYEDSTERMFLVSRGEVYGGNENGINEGKPYPYYSEFSDLASASTGADVNRIKYKNSTAAYWWLRSCNSGNGNNVRNVNPSGSINLSYASSSIGVAPACNII